MTRVYLVDPPVARDHIEALLATGAWLRDRTTINPGDAVHVLIVRWHARTIDIIERGLRYLGYRAPANGGHMDAAFNALWLRWAREEIG